MIRRNNRSKSAQASEPFTYIHGGTTVTGDLQAEGRVRVHGRIYGNVEVEGVLEVAESGAIEGDHVRALEIKIIGSVKADVHAKGKIEIWQKGRLEGDVRASSLDIEEGATFIGRSEMTPTGGPIGNLTENAASLRETAPEAETESEAAPESV